MTKRPILAPDPLMTATGDRPTPTNWALMPDSEYAMALDELATWVHWLAATHDLDSSTIPDCWTAHPQLVEAIGALRDCWRYSYHPASDANQPIQWVSALHGHLNRLREETTGLYCDHD